MLDKEPFSFPSRARFTYDPGIPDRQLWAIGMIVVQWSMTEWFIDMSTRNLIGDNREMLDEYKKVRGFQQSLLFWKELVQKTNEPFRTHALALIPTVGSLSSQRDEVVHRLWGGGMEGASWSAAGLETGDAGLLPNPGEKLNTKSSGGPIPFTWNATFSRLKRMATEMAALNTALLGLLFLPNAPHGFVDHGKARK